MKKSLFTFAAIAMVLSFTSCKETSSEQSENSEVMETETPIEATEIPAEKAMDTVSVDSMQVKENMTETENN